MLYHRSGRDDDVGEPGVCGDSSLLSSGRKLRRLGRDKFGVTPGLLAAWTDGFLQSLMPL